MSSTRVRASTSSIWRGLGRKRTLGRRSRARRSSLVVPQPGTTPNAISGRRAAVSRKMGSPLTTRRRIGDRRGEGQDLGNLGLTYATLGDRRKAIECYEQALVILREI